MVANIPRGLEAEIPMMPALYALYMFRFLRKKGISREAMLDGMGIDTSLFEQPDAQLSMRQIQPLLERAVELSPDPRTGFEFGRELDLQKHGLLGFSLLRRMSFRELVIMNVQYLRVRLPLMEIQLEDSEQGLTLTIQDMWPLGKARDFVTQIYMGSICSLAGLVTRNLELCFDFPPPANPGLYEQLAGCPVAFSRSSNQAFLPLTHAGQSRAADRAHVFVSQTARTDFDLEDDREVAVQVRHLVLKDPGRHSSLESIAANLGLSARSLRRQLQRAGFSFSDIRNDVRKEFALRYLTGTRMPLEKIAARLGYSDQASFSKAFRSWTGRTPGQIRREGRPEAR